MSMIDRCKFLHNLPCEQVSDRITELEEENAKLHNVEFENASLRGAVQGLGELCDKYKSENAELHELISLMAVRWLPNDVRMTLDEWHERDERIRGKLLELGIEVKYD